MLKFDFKKEKPLFECTMGLQKFAKCFQILQRKKKKKLKKFRHSNIRTFEMPKTLKNKKIYCQKIIENIYIYTHTNLCVCDYTIEKYKRKKSYLKKKKKFIGIAIEIFQIVSNIEKKKKKELKIQMLKLPK